MSSSAPKRVLCTGVSGQDGSYMADYLLAHTDHLVYGMVRRTAKPDYGNLKQALGNPRFKLVIGDLSDAHSIDTLVRDIQPDYLINLAAQSFVGSSWTIGEQTIDVTGTGVYRCLEAIRKHAPHCRLYSAGSSEQFGKVAYSPQDEGCPYNPQSPYGAAKCLADHLVKVYRRSYGLYAVHGILFNHESERRGEEFVTRKITLGVARIAKAIRDGQPFEPIRLGNLDAKRDWSHAEDFVEGIWRMVNQEVHRTAMRGVLPQHLSRCLEEYVLASGQTFTVRSFVEKAFTAAGIEGIWGGEGIDERYTRLVQYPGAKVTKESLVQIDPAHFRPAEVDLLLGDPTRAKTELGWSPKVSFDELVTRMVRNDCAAAGVELP